MNYVCVFERLLPTRAGRIDDAALHSTRDVDGRFFSAQTSPVALREEAVRCRPVHWDDDDDDVRSGRKRMESTGKRGETAREKRVLRGRTSAGHPTLLRLTGGRFARDGIAVEEVGGPSPGEQTPISRERRGNRAFPRGRVAYGDIAAISRD